MVVTRPRLQAEDLSSRLRKRGAEVLEAPTIRIADPPDRESLRRAVRRIETYDWVVFTSVNGVQRFIQAFEETGLAVRLPERARLAAIGPSTAAAASPLGLSRPVVPETYRAESLVEAILAAARTDELPSGIEPDRTSGDRALVVERDSHLPLSGRKVLLPRAAEARSVLPDELRAAGAEVDEVEAYVTLPDPEEAETLRRRLTAGDVDWITFTSSSTVRSYVQLLGAETGPARIAAIGPITAGTARGLGLSVAVVADEYTIPGLVAALESTVIADRGAR